MCYPIFSMMDGSFQADLMCYPELKTINDGYDSVMICIESTTRKGYCNPLRGKKIQAILVVLDTLMNET